MRSGEAYATPNPGYSRRPVTYAESMRMPGRSRGAAARSPTSFAVCDLLPPLRYATGSLSAALGLSVLTHLSVSAHNAWLTEFSRVVRPGGGVVLTTHGEAFRDRLGAADRRRYDAGEVFEVAYGPEGHRLYAAYHPPVGFRALAGDAFAVRRHIPGQRHAWGVQQDVWVLERRG